MRHYSAIWVLTVLAICTIVPHSASAAFKCWKNNEGVRECGNAVPPEFAQQGHETVSNQGLTREEQGAAKTMEELTAEREAAAEARKAATLAKEQADYDRVLLDTFSTEDDLIMTRDGKIKQLESQITLTRSHIDKLQANLDRMMERAAEVERNGETPKDELLRGIDSVRGQISDNEKFIANQKAEQAKITARFDADIARFRELKGAR